MNANRLNIVARRQLERLSRSSRAVFRAERIDNLNEAKKWLETGMGLEEYDLMDVMVVAEYIAGDRIVPD